MKNELLNIEQYSLIRLSLDGCFKIDGGTTGDPAAGKGVAYQVGYYAGKAVGGFLMLAFYMGVWGD